MKKIILSLLCGILLCNITGCGNNIELGNTKTKLNENNNDIYYSVQQYSEKKYVVIAKNKTGKTIENVKAKIIFYDKNNVEVKADTSTHDIDLIDGEVTIFTMSNSGKEFDHYAVTFEYEESDDVSSYSGLTYSSIEQNNDTNYDILLKISSSEERPNSHRALSIVFYNNNKVVGVSTDDNYSMPKGGTAEFIMSSPKDNDGNKVRYDRFEIFVVS